MELIIDAGNSNLVFAIYGNSKYLCIDRVETSYNLPVAFFYGYFSDLLLENNVSAESIHNISISSVVSELTDLLTHSVEAYFGKKPVVLSAETHLKLEMIIPKPYEIGSDLVANAYAVRSKIQKEAIVVDFGTALTFTVVSKRGIEGVTIAPGLKTSINALSSNTSKLPEVPLRLPDSAIGKDTIHAIQAGVMYGYVGLVKEVVGEIKKEIGDHYITVATGGMSEILKPLEGFFDMVEKSLTLDGIRLIGNTVKR